MNYLSLDDILAIRDELATARRSHGDSDRYTIRSFHGLQAALSAPARSAFGAVFYPSLPEKASALVFGLIQNHPFYDGNKRIATRALRLFLERNGALLGASPVELQQFTRQIALGTLRTDAITVWVQQHVRNAPGRDMAVAHGD